MVRVFLKHSRIALVVLALFWRCASPTIPDKVDRITLSPGSLSLTKNLTDGTADSAIVTASVEPSTATTSTVTWTSDTPAVAEVFGGVVYPGNGVTLGVSTAIITATSTDGTNVSSNSVTVTVTVNP
ncbi:MAG TPA: hypothetical protein VMW87_17140 [Spirochaetia bacterium]|nr:hypothetical protein [Spirochaetia bacterium]